MMSGEWSTESELARLRRRAEEAEAQARALQALNGFAATLLRYQSDIDDILWELANDAVGRMGLEDCVIYLLDEERGLLVQRAAYGPKNPKGREILAPITLTVGRGIVGAVAATGQVERIGDTRLDPRYVCDDQLRLSELAVPILDEGRVIGVIDSEHSAANFFTPWHEELFLTLARMTASRLSKARLDEQLQRLTDGLEREVAQRTAELAEAHRRSETLLQNVLPASIAARLMAGESRIAERVERAAVLFADIVGFSEYAAHAEPEQVVELLETFFTTFDTLTAEAGAEKIKTVGDAYMVVCGLPTPHADPAGALAELALKMRDSLPELAARAHVPLAARFGLHVGPVVAGVIGRSRLVYDLWGDTVNVAARLESSGLPGRVQITRALASELSDRFVCVPRGVQTLKGLGEVELAWLVNKR
ncbi:MAG: hypothetical protein RIT28_4162 [Pseudomonadota bacterium]